MTQTPVEQPPKEAKSTRKNSVLAALRKSNEANKKAEQAYLREGGSRDQDLVKLRSILSIAIPGWEKQVKIARIMDEPGIREFCARMGLRV